MIQKNFYRVNLTYFMMKKRMMRLGTYISHEAYDMMQELVSEYGTQTKVLEVAIRLLYDIHRQGLNVRSMLFREELIENFDCVVITRSNLENFIHKENEKFFKEDFINAMVKFALRKLKTKEPKIRDLIKVIKDIYVYGARWFSNIVLDEELTHYEVTFTHTSDLQYSNFFATYFKNFFDRTKYNVEDVEISSKFFSIILEE